jgi:hypothetical protein
MTIIAWLLVGCLKIPVPQENMKKSSKQKGTSCLLIQKIALSKRGTPFGKGDLYVRCSIQDYFIKVCESNVSREELLPFLNKGITVDMEIRDGEWDRCPNDPEHIQSRIGTYAVIYNIHP